MNGFETNGYGAAADDGAAGDDPRLTRYALGEMDDAERAAFEAEVGPDGLAEAVEIGRFAEQLEGEFTAEHTAEHVAELTQGQRSLVRHAADQVVAPGSGRRFAGVTRWAVRAAAAVVLSGALALSIHALVDQPEDSEVTGVKPVRIAETGLEGDIRPAAETGIGEPVVDSLEGSAQDAAIRDGVRGEAPVAAYEMYRVDMSADFARPMPTINNLVTTTEEASKSDGFSALSVASGSSEVRLLTDFREASSRGLSSVNEPGLKMPVESKADRESTGTDLFFFGSGSAVRRFEGDDKEQPEVFLPADLPTDLPNSAPAADALSDEQPSTESYDRIEESPFQRVADLDVSTFSIDVDSASYANVRRFLNHDQLPPIDSVRIEELINAFQYDDAPPAADAEHPFAVHVEVAQCPWRREHRLARVGIKGKVIEKHERPSSNLVFLLDVSGSMGPDNKLPLLKQGLRMLVEELDERDHVSIVVYAGAAGLVLPPTPAHRQDEILTALDRLQAGGSTNGGSGIELAYRTAIENFVDGGTNRVILCTDGDFNVGVADRGSLTRLIEDKAKSGVFLSVLGFGLGNLKDATMEDLSNRGNGNYAYIDNLDEARRVLVEEMGGTLITIAKDVKIQVFFNPKTVAGWRLIGYENRELAARDFNDDAKDAGEIGAGHSITALYEVVPMGAEVPGRAKVDANPFVATQQAMVPEAGATPSSDAPVIEDGALFQLRLRYKQPMGTTSTLLESIVTDADTPFTASSTNLRWSAAVAGFGMLLRHSKHVGDLHWEDIEGMARLALGADQHGHRAEFVALVAKAAGLASDGR